MRCLRIPVGGAAYWSVADDDYRLLPLENDFLRHVRFGRDRAEATTRRYAESLRVFAEWRARTDRQDLGQALGELHLFVTWLRLTPVERPGRGQGRPRSAARINQMLAAVRELAKFAVHGGHLPGSALAALWEVGDDRGLPEELSTEGAGLRYRAAARHHLRPVVPHEPAAATRAEVAALLGAARSWRDRFLIWLLWTCGLRIGAALGLRRSDLHLVDDARALGCQVPGPHLHVVGRDNPNGAAVKGSRYHVPVRADLLGLYELYLVERDSALGRDDCDFVLVNLFHAPLGSPMTYPVARQMLAALSRRAGLSRVITPHMVRHGLGRALIEAGEDISMVKELLGHRALASTQVYVTPDQGRLRAAVEALPPLPSGRPR
jgi:integrase/recombinase XerD